MNSEYNTGKTAKIVEKKIKKNAMLVISRTVNDLWLNQLSMLKCDF